MHSFKIQVLLWGVSLWLTGLCIKESFLFHRIDITFKRKGQDISYPMLFKRRDSGFNNMAWSHVLHHVGIWIDAKTFCSRISIGGISELHQWMEGDRQKTESVSFYAAIHSFKCMFAHCLVFMQCPCFYYFLELPNELLIRFTRNRWISDTCRFLLSEKM